MNRQQMSLTALGFGLFLFAAINVWSGVAVRDSRLDLTADGLYTLSPGTKHILEQIPEPITLRLYFSEKLSSDVPGFRVYGARVRELLEEYANRSKGMIKLQVIDPEPFSDDEDRAVKLGIQGVPLDQQSGQQVYFGLVGTNSTDRREVIPFFQQEREAFLEYDLTKLVYALTDPKKPVVGVLSEMPLEFGAGGVMAAMRGQSQPYAVLEQLRQSFEVRLLKNDLSRIDDEIKVLVLARPKNLPPAAQFAVDQFVLKGGRVVALVDPWAESAAAQTNAAGLPDAGTSQEANVPALLKAWGLELVPGKFVADPKLALRVADGEGNRRRTVPYPAWLSIPAANLDHDDVITTNLKSLNLASAGALKVLPDTGLTVRPLITSSDQAQLVDLDKIKLRADPDAVTGALTGQGERQILAARITGTVKTAFPDGAPAAPPAKADAAKPDAAPAEATAPATAEAKPEGEAAAATAETKPAGEAKAEPAKTETGAEAGALKESRQPANLIVIADSDLLEDRFWVQSQDFFGQRFLVPMASNADLLVNAIDNLTGSNDLIGLRGRAGSARPFTVVEDLRRAASRKFQAQEQELRRQLLEAQKQINDLEGKSKGGSSTLLSPEEQAAIDRFKQQVLQTRKELRDVQHNLNRDIDALSTTVKAINIGLMPLLVALVAVVAAGWRRRRRATPVRD